GPESIGQARSQRRQHVDMFLDLRTVGGNQRNAAVGRTSFRFEQSIHRRGVERIDGEAVERVGRQRDDLAEADPFRGFLDRIALRRLGIHEDAPHAVSTIVRRTTIAQPPMMARLTTNTARMFAPASSPATNGLIAMPVSDALVTTPKPVPCAPAGIPRPAAP